MSTNDEIEKSRELRNKLAKQIVDIYPKMFTFCVRLNCEPDPYETYGKGMGVGIGWYPIIKKLVETIHENDTRMNLEKNADHITKVTDIKEKFGGLRFYVTATSEENWKAIGKAEEESYYTCEECGSREDVGRWNAGWILTKCKKCALEEFEKGNWKDGVTFSEIFQTWNDIEQNKYDD